MIITKNMVCPLVVENYNTTHNPYMTVPDVQLFEHLFSEICTKTFKPIQKTDNYITIGKRTWIVNNDSAVLLGKMGLREGRLRPGESINKSDLMESHVNRTSRTQDPANVYVRDMSEVIICNDFRLIQVEPCSKSYVYQRVEKNIDYTLSKINILGEDHWTLRLPNLEMFGVTNPYEGKPFIIKRGEIPSSPFKLVEVERGKVDIIGNFEFKFLRPGGVVESYELVGDRGRYILKPFAGYTNFDDCVRHNKSKGNPKAYCATIMRRVEGK